MDRNNKINADSKDSGKSSFFHNLFASLFKSSNPDAEKKRKLKALAKTFSKTKYHAFYKPNSGEVQASFAKLMWEIYKVISQSQLYIKSAQNPSIFKRQIINYTMSEKQLELLEHFDEQKILEMSKKLPLQKIQTTLEEELQFFTNQFDNERMNRGENLFKAFTIFKDFCEYDFYVLLRKFDTTIQEYQSDAAPHSEKVNEFKSFMSEPMVCEALHKAKTTGIGIQRRLILCFIRLKMYRVLEILGFLRRKQLENK